MYLPVEQESFIGLLISSLVIILPIVIFAILKSTNKGEIK